MKNFRQNSIMNPHVPIIQLQQLMFCHFLFQQDFYHLPTPTRFCFLSEKVLLHPRAGAQSCLAAAFLWLQGHCSAPLGTDICPHRFLVGLQGQLVRRDPEQLPIGGAGAPRVTSCVYFVLSEAAPWLGRVLGHLWPLRRPRPWVAQSQGCCFSVAAAAEGEGFFQ